MARAAMAKLSWEKYALRPVQSAPPASLPVFIYGTAWKKDQSSDLVYQAIKSGFRAVDTAGQPKHYREDLVGDGVRRAIKDGTVRREDLHVSWSLSPMMRKSQYPSTGIWIGMLSGMLDSNQVHLCAGPEPR